VRSLARSIAAVAWMGSSWERARRPKRRARAYHKGRYMGARLATSMWVTASAWRPARVCAMPKMSTNSALPDNVAAPVDWHDQRSTPRCDAVRVSGDRFDREHIKGVVLEVARRGARDWMEEREGIVSSPFLGEADCADLTGDHPGETATAAELRGVVLVGDREIEFRRTDLGDAEPPRDRTPQ
jgi:hypothetical protein